MSNLRVICRPNMVFFSFMCSRHPARSRVSFRIPASKSRPHRPSAVSSWLHCSDAPRTESWFRDNRRRSMVTSSKWSGEGSPYETLELERDADEEKVKLAYRRLVKSYHPDVYDGKGTLEEGETAEARFIKIQAAYELLIDRDKRRQYDIDNRINPMKASQAWMMWLMKRRRAFEQRGGMAFTAWAEQQEREMNLRARRSSRSKGDPEEERRYLEREKKASKEFVSTTLKRHTLVMKKRDMARKKAEEEKREILSRLLAEEGLELETEGDDEAA